MLDAEAHDLLGLPLAGPEAKQRGLVEPPEQLLAAARRSARGGAGEADEVDGEVAVVGAAAFLRPVDQCDQAIRDLLPGAAPGVGLLREHPHVATGLVHRGGERLLRSRVALGVEDDHLPVRRRGHAVGQPSERDGLARARSADHQQRSAEPRKRHPHASPDHRQHLVAADLAPKFERTFAAGRRFA